MGAKIIVVAGPLTGNELWIEYDVARLGADDDCELHLPESGLAPHVLTLRYSGGRYLAYNRGGETLRLGKTTVEPNGSAPWADGATLHLPGGTELRLETSGDGTPAPRPNRPAMPTMVEDAGAFETDVPVPAPGSAAAPVAEAAPKKKSGQAIVIGLLFAAAVGILLMDDPAPGGPAVKVKPFDVLAAELRNEPQLSPDLWIRFDEAYTRAYRGKPADALAAYRTLRDRIDWEKNHLSQAGKPYPPALRDADDYVKHRLAGGK